MDKNRNKPVRKAIVYGCEPIANIILNDEKSICKKNPQGLAALRIFLVETSRLELLTSCV